MENKKITKKQICIIAAIAGAVILAIIICFIATKTCLFSHKWTEATCIAPKTCERCLKTEGEALGHDFKDPDCTSPKICKRCNEKEGKPLGHTVTEWITDKEPNCTESGLRHGICTVCNEEIREKISEKGHSLGKWEIGTKATLTSAGEKVQKCTVCGETVNTDKYNLTEEEKQAIKAAEEKAQKEAAEKAEKEAKAAIAKKYPISVTSERRAFGDQIIIDYTITNNTSQKVNYMKLRCTLYDSNGKALTSGTGYVTDLPAGEFEERAFYITCSESVSNYDITIEEVE